MYPKKSSLDSDNKQKKVKNMVIRTRNGAIKILHWRQVVLTNVNEFVAFLAGTETPKSMKQ